MKLNRQYIFRQPPKLQPTQNQLLTAAIVLSTIAIFLALPFAIFLWSMAYVWFISDNNMIYGIFNADSYRNEIVY